MMLAQQPMVRMNDGHQIPQVGLGVWQLSDSEVLDVVGHAFGKGYRHVDTAYAYRNERAVGEAMRRSGLLRQEMFVTTKLWNAFHGHDEALRAFDASAERLGVEYVDLYLIHWPCPSIGRYPESWKALVRLRDEGRVRSIGVSNFDEICLDVICGETGVVPSVNQIELHPGFQQRAMRALHDRLGIATQSWSPLGQGLSLVGDVLAGIARHHGKSVSQVILRWHLQLGLIVIPRSRSLPHVSQNFELFDFELSEADMAAIASLDDPEGRIGPLPQEFSNS